MCGNFSGDLSEVCIGSLSSNALSKHILTHAAQILAVGLLSGEGWTHGRHHVCAVYFAPSCLKSQRFPETCKCYTRLAISTLHSNPGFPSNFCHYFLKKLEQSLSINTPLLHQYLKCQLIKFCLLCHYFFYYAFMLFSISFQHFTVSFLSLLVIARWLFLGHTQTMEIYGRNLCFSQTKSPVAHSLQHFQDVK